MNYICSEHVCTQKVSSMFGLLGQFGFNGMEAYAREGAYGWVL